MAEHRHPGAVIVVGSINTDLVVTAPRIVRPGETISGTGFATGQGGKGANQASAAASAGALVSIVGRVGDDANGREAVTALVRLGIDTAHVATTDAPTGVALIQVAADGENAITVVAGANERLAPADVDDAFASLDATDAIHTRETVVVLCLEIPLQAVTRAARSARSRGWTVVLNPAPAPAGPLPGDLLDVVDVLVPNEHEAEAMGGIAALMLSGDGAGPAAVVVTRGENGAVLLRGGERVEVPAVAVQPVDTTGAGDAFIGVLAASLAEGRDLPDCVRRAVAGGAIATLGAGARGSLPTASAIERMLADG